MAYMYYNTLSPFFCQQENTSLDTMGYHMGYKDENVLALALAAPTSIV